MARPFFARLRCHVARFDADSDGRLSLAEVTAGLPLILRLGADLCKHDGWSQFAAFKNQGDCVSFFATGGQNQPAGGN